MGRYRGCASARGGIYIAPAELLLPVYISARNKAESISSAPRGGGGAEWGWGEAREEGGREEEERLIKINGLP